ncbi:MAG: hypothetical protein IPG32_07500 [Saprospirales bacterium]|nr:hypothetical protein [Saprospirales bacterium]
MEANDDTLDSFGIRGKNKAIEISTGVRAAQSALLIEKMIKGKWKIKSNTKEIKDILLLFKYTVPCNPKLF